LERFIRDQKIQYYNKKSNQEKFTKERLAELRKPIDEYLGGFSNSYLNACSHMIMANFELKLNHFLSKFSLIGNNLKTLLS